MFNKIKNWMNQRSQEMEEAAQLLQMDYTKKDEYGLLNLLTDFKLFSRGGRKQIKHILHAKDFENDLDLNIFDYQYTISTGNSAAKIQQTVFFIQSKTLALPEFYMKPEHFFHKIASYFGKEDIDFNEHPTFSDQYYLKGENQNAIRNMMNEETLHFFTIEKNWSLEGIGYYLIFYRNKKRLSKLEIQEFYKKGLSIFQFLQKE